MTTSADLCTSFEKMLAIMIAYLPTLGSFRGCFQTTKKRSTSNLLNEEQAVVFCCFGEHVFLTELQKTTSWSEFFWRCHNSP